MKKILVIEDEAFVRDNLVELLELENYCVVSAGDGLTGIELVHRDRPDLILCDVMMPHVDGHTVLQTLKQDAVTATIPFIFLTARTHQTDLASGLALGANAYLSKPYSAADLLTVVERLLTLSVE